MPVGPRLSLCVRPLLRASIRFAYLGRRGHSRAPDDTGRLGHSEIGNSRDNDAVPPRNERAIAEDIVARCLGVAADVGPRLAERVAEAVREATTL